MTKKSPKKNTVLSTSRLQRSSKSTPLEIKGSSLPTPRGCPVPVSSQWKKNLGWQWYCWCFRNPARKPVEVGSWSHYLQFFFCIVVQDFFHQQYVHTNSVWLKTACLKPVFVRKNKKVAWKSENKHLNNMKLSKTAINAYSSMNRHIIWHFLESYWIEISSFCTSLWRSDQNSLQHADDMMTCT